MLYTSVVWYAPIRAGFLLAMFGCACGGSKQMCFRTVFTMRQGALRMLDACTDRRDASSSSPTETAIAWHGSAKAHVACRMMDAETLIVR